MKTNHFLGTWILDAAQSNYQFGTPPQSGRYTIEQDGERLVFRMAWVDAEGEAYQASFDGIPDGQDYPLAEETAVADTVCLFFEDSRNLVSTAKRDGGLILHARRTLSDDLRQMTVVQSGQTPAGHYANEARYWRQEDTG